MKPKKPFKLPTENLKPLEYPNKILVAWAEAISGNKKIRDWLLKSEYQELGIFIFAMYNKDEARIWLIKNGFAHLFALINAGEGNKLAKKWLKDNNEDILYNMAIYIDRENKGVEWLLKRNEKVFAMLAKRIRVVKDTIDDDNNDPHQINFY